MKLLITNMLWQRKKCWSIHEKSKLQPPEPADQSAAATGTRTLTLAFPRWIRLERSLLVLDPGCQMELGTLSRLKKNKQHKQRCTEWSSYKEDMAWTWRYSLDWASLRDPWPPHPQPPPQQNSSSPSLGSCVRVSLIVRRGQITSEFSENRGI